MLSLNLFRYAFFFFCFRTILLSTIPVLIIALITLATLSLLNKGQEGSATISLVSIVLYNCFFVMGFGPIPAMICAEIFPTHIRGLCIAICTLAFWTGDTIVTYTTPVVLASFGPGCFFGIFAVMCIISWFFVYLRVPETKGMTLEKITQFFSVSSLPKTIAWMERIWILEWYSCLQLLILVKCVTKLKVFKISNWVQALPVLSFQFFASKSWLVYQM